MGRRMARRRPGRRPTTLAVAICVLAGGFLTAGGAQAAARSVGCGAVITVSTKLQSDLLDCPGSGLVIGSDDVTVDLGGHAVDGLGGLAPFGSAGIDNSGGYDNVVIKNGAVQQFDQGVVLVGTSGDVVRGVRVSDNRSDGFFVDGLAASDSSDNRLIGNEASGNGEDGISLRGSNGNTLRSNTSTANGTVGVSVAFSSQRNTIRGNTLTGNQGQGVFLLDLADGNDLVSNRIVGNGLAGVLISGSNRNRVVANTIGHNAEGIDVLSGDRPLGSDDNVLARNLVEGNAGDGIFAYGPSEFMGTQIPGATGTVVMGNSTTGNGDDGIDVRSAATTITSNGADRNLDLGIDAVAGVTDGGGNHAAGNGNALQCVNVTCS